MYDCLQMTCSEMVILETGVASQKKLTKYMKSKDERSKVNLMTFTYLLTEYRINIDISMFRQCRILGFVDIQCISVQDWRLWLWIYIHGYPPPTSSSSLSS